MDEAYRFLHETTIAPGVALNEFQTIRHLADDTYTAHPTINNDTLHVMGWLDLGAEPVLVTVPDADEGRYWILHTMDLGHYTNAMIGSRTRGARGGTFLFAARAWDGEVPADVTEVVRSESDVVKLMGRIMATAAPGDLAVAQALMDGWRLETLSRHLGVEGPAPVVRTYPDPAASTWLERVTFVLRHGSMAEADRSWLERYTALGLDPAVTAWTPAQLEAAERGQRLAMEHLVALAPSMTVAAQLLGTREDLQDGPRDLFAEGTYLGQWGLPPVESVYMKTETATDGSPINGNDGRRFRMRFPAPDVSEFWSITVYSSDDRLMAHNALNRHSRGDRTLTPDDDGLYTIELAASGSADDASYLPIPEKDAYLILRLYGPSQAIQDGDYAMPDVVAID
ncbi:DUF1254 domain-containing protein [Nocardioides sp. GY 10127]|nr:DUF1254 domain-containing protein [Nocardioides sp. GY 10127]